MRYQKLSTLVVFVMFCGFFITGVFAKDSGVPKEKTIVVDCNKGGSINNALKDTTEKLYIEIQGMCTERVVVERDNVFLLGNPDDGGPDGIIAPDMPNPFINVWPQLQYAIEIEVIDIVGLLIKNSRYVYLGKGLTFELGPNEGGYGVVRVVNSLVSFENTDILNSRGYGMIVEDSTVLANDIDLNGCNVPTGEDNPCLGGIIAIDGSQLIFSSDDPENAENYNNITYGGDYSVGLIVGIRDDEEIMGSAHADLEYIHINAPKPVEVANGSTLNIEDGSITRLQEDGEVALQIENGSRAILGGVGLHGGFRVWDRSQLTLRNVSQSEEGVYEGKNNDNRVLLESSLSADQNCYLTGTLRLDHSIADIRRSLLEAFATPENSSPDAVQAGNGSSVNLVDVDLLGSFNVFTTSRISLAGGMFQEEILNTNRISRDSYLDVWAAEIWRTRLDSFSHGEVHVRENRIHGDLTCENGSDVFCREPVTLFNASDSGISTCLLCPTSP